MTDYVLSVSPGTGGTPEFQAWYTPAVCAGSVCTATPETVLLAGSYTWRVRGRNATGFGGWSGPASFTVLTPPAPATSLPTGGIYTPTPTYRWTPSAGATSYFLQVGDGSVIEFQGGAGASDLCVGSNCSWTPTKALAQGAHWWAVQAKNESGGTWSSNRSFTVLGPPAPTPLSPMGLLATHTPTYTWSAVAGEVQHYVVWVDDDDEENPSPAFQGWYTPAEAACTGGTCRATSTVPLPVGNYTFQMRARNATGPGDWSGSLSFRVEAPHWQVYDACFGVLLVGDFSGDGRTDRLCSTNGVTYVSVSGTGGLTLGSAWLIHQLQKPVVGDFDGDGKTDIGEFEEGTGTFRVARSTGTGFAPLTEWGTASAGQASCQPGTREVGSGDVDGDSLTDVYCKASASGYVLVGRSTGHSFSFSLFATFQCDVAGERVGVADFDADGQSDWYCVSKPGGSLLPLLSNGTSFESGRFTGLGNGFCVWDRLVLTDLNGDGTTDAYCPTNGKLAFSTGVSFIEQQDPFGAYCVDGKAFPADLDSDGRADLVCDHGGKPANDIEVRRWTGAGLTAPTTWRGSWCGNVVTPGDFDGDGKTDLLCDHTQLAGSGTSGVMPDLMVEAGGGIGGRTMAEYTPTTFQPQSELVGTNEGAVKQVVRALRVEDGRGGASTTRHVYSGARHDRKERMSLGFGWTKTTLPCLEGETACPYVVTTHSQELASVGKPLVTTRYDGAGSPLTARSFEYRNKTALPRTSVLARANEVVHGTGQENRQTATVYDYDEWGNQTLVRTEGDATALGDELDTVLAYRPNLTSYIVSRVAQVEQRAPSAGDSLTRVRYEYDGSGNWTAPPTKGDVTAVVRRLKWEPPQGGSGSEDRDVATRRGYDAVGNLTSVTDETNRTVTMTYDSMDNLFVEKVTNAAGEEETKVARFNRLCGAPEEVEDANRQRTETKYDALCRPTRTNLPGGGFVERKYLALGDPGQQRTRVETLAATGVSGVDWSETSFDGLGRAYETRRRGPESRGDIVTERTFNLRGGLESSTEPFYEGESGRVTSYEYDTLGRLVLTQLPGRQHTSEMSYGLWSQTATDPNGKTVESQFDAYGRTVEVVRKLDGRDIVTKMRYDPLGRQIRLEDAIGNVWRWGVDSLGRLRDKQDPDAGRWIYTPDDAGRPKTQVDAKGQTTTLDYEPSGRLASRTSGAGLVTYIYGQERAGYQNVGRLTTITSPAETTELDYDEHGRVVRQKRTIDGARYVVKKAYDDAGFLLGTEYPDGDTVGTTQNPLVYDAAGRLRAIPGIVTEIEYDAAGRPLVRVNANPTRTTWEYTQDRGFLDRIRTTGPAGLIQDLDYEIDPRGWWTS